MRVLLIFSSNSQASQSMNVFPNVTIPNYYPQPQFCCCLKALTFNNRLLVGVLNITVKHCSCSLMLYFGFESHPGRLSLRSSRDERRLFLSYQHGFCSCDQNLGLECNKSKTAWIHDADTVSTRSITFHHFPYDHVHCLRLRPSSCFCFKVTVIFLSENHTCRTIQEAYLLYKSAELFYCFIYFSFLLIDCFCFIDYEALRILIITVVTVFSCSFCKHTIKEYRWRESEVKAGSTLLLRFIRHALPSQASIFIGRMQVASF